MIIDQAYVEDILEKSKETTREEIDEILKKAKTFAGLNHLEIGKLLQSQEKHQLEEMYKIAGDIKKRIYGNRIVVFAPPIYK